MHQYLKAIGFENIQTRKELKKILKEVEDSFHHQTVVSYHDSTDFCELQKSFGQGIGITVCGELDEEEEFDFNYYFPYFEGDGVKSKDIKNPKEISFSSVSINLLNDIRDILFSFGIIGTIKKKYDEHCGEIMGRKVHLNEKFELVLSKNNSQKLSNILNLNYKYKIKNRPYISYSFFNEDE